MIYYKFSTCAGEHTLGYTVRGIFRGAFEESWMQDPLIHQIVTNVEEATYVGNGWLQSASGNPYRIEQISHGLQTLICAYFGVQDYFKIDAIGENLYRYLDVLFRDRDIHLVGVINPYFLASIAKTSFPPMHLTQFGVTVSNAEDLQEYYYTWTSTTEQSFKSVSQFQDNNPRLKKPVTLEFSPDKYTRNYPKFNLVLSHKITFIEGPSSSGKSYFFEALMQLQEARLLQLDEWILQPLLIREQLDRFMIPTGKTILLIDMDNLDCGIDELLSVVNLPFDVLVLCVGHDATLGLYAAFDSIYTIHFDKNANHISFMRLVGDNGILQSNTKSSLFNKE